MWHIIRDDMVWTPRWQVEPQWRAMALAASLSREPWPWLSTDLVIWCRYRGPIVTPRRLGHDAERYQPFKQLDPDSVPLWSTWRDLKRSHQRHGHGSGTTGTTKKWIMTMPLNGDGKVEPGLDHARKWQWQDRGRPWPCHLFGITRDLVAWWLKNKGPPQRGAHRIAPARLPWVSQGPRLDSTEGISRTTCVTRV